MSLQKSQNLVIWIFLVVTLGSCSSKQSLDSQNAQVSRSGNTYKPEEVDPSIITDLAKAQLGGISKDQSRTLAAESAFQEMRIDLLGLRSLHPKKFSIFVFPKDSRQTFKFLSDSGVVLAKPYEVEVSPLATVGCSAFGKGNFAKYNPKAYFPDELMKSKRNCAIIEFTSMKLSGLPKNLWRAGDVHRKRIYIDDGYRAYGMETEVVAGGRDLTTIKHKLDPREGLSSSLDGIPVDLPILEAAFQTEGGGREPFALRSLATPEVLRWAYDSKRPLDRRSLSQIKKKDQKFELSNCQGQAFTYKDSMRKTVKVYWCEGFAWPQAIETNQYFAVTQNFGVK